MPDIAITSGGAARFHRFAPSGWGAITRAAAAALLLLLGGAGIAHGREVKIATWNLNWLTLRADGDPALPADVHPRQPADFARLRAYALHLDADVVAFQEVDGAAAAAAVFPPGRYRIALIDEPVVQQVGIAVRRDITLTRNPDLTALDPYPLAPHPLRDGLDVTLGLPGGLKLRVLAVHLKTGCWGQALGSSRPACRTLGEQLAVLQDWIASRRVEGVPFLVMGDFNRRMVADDEFEAALDAAAPLTRVTAGFASPCWGGEDFIDHIFLGGPARAWLEPNSLRVLTYRETDPAMRERISDHCPVAARLDIPN